MRSDRFCAVTSISANSEPLEFCCWSAVGFDWSMDDSARATALQGGTPNAVLAIRQAFNPKTDIFLFKFILTPPRLFRHFSANEHHSVRQLFLARLATRAALVYTPYRLYTDKPAGQR